MESASDDLRREADARVGTTLLDKWRLDALIGLGGMAAVFAATHRNGLRGALKILWASCSCDEDIRRRFLLEGYIANRVDHPGAVRVLDDDVTPDGRAFLVMELLDGYSLQLLAESQGGTLDAARVLVVADQVLDVLASAHDRGIIHRDIKPENLFLTIDGQVKVLDFGIARLDERKHALRATQSGSPMGTPGFMAPEQARGRWDLVGPQSDLWSVGATMFTLLSGATVHEGETTAEIVAAAFTKPARPLATAMVDCPKPIAELVDRALLLDRTARWCDAREMQKAVRDAYEAVYGEALPALVPQIPMFLVRRPTAVAPFAASVDFPRAPAASGRKWRMGSVLSIGSAAAAALWVLILSGSAPAQEAAFPAVTVAEDTLAPPSRAEPQDGKHLDATQDDSQADAFPDDLAAPSSVVATYSVAAKAGALAPHNRTRANPGAVSTASLTTLTALATPAPLSRPVAMSASARSVASASTRPSSPDLKALFDRRL